MHISGADEFGGSKKPIVVQKAKRSFVQLTRSGILQKVRTIEGGVLTSLSWSRVFPGVLAVLFVGSEKFILK